jgi:hypothetical protein
MGNDLEKRVRQFHCLELPGQPQGMHMGTSYLVGDLWSEVQRLRELLFERGAMEDAPCFCCGYNGPGYFQPDQHPCAAKHHDGFGSEA